MDTTMLFVEIRDFPTSRTKHVRDMGHPELLQFGRL
jgi:hypothetical protein